jgi:sporulation protein YlmC with PRC-barrel domain
MTATGTERARLRDAWIREVCEWRGRNVVDQEGTKVGRLEEVYLDQQTGRPEWLLIHTGLFGTKSSFAPLAGARVAGEDVRIGHSKQEVKDAPSLEADRELSQEEEARLYAHYGLDYSEPRSDTGMPRASGPTGRPSGGT